jgi:hypothetical protein
VSKLDPLSNSGLYPALPIPGRQRGKDESAGERPPDPRGNKAQPKAVAPSDPAAPRPPKSLIDDYA